MVNKQKRRTGRSKESEKWKKWHEDILSVMPSGEEMPLWRIASKLADIRDHLIYQDVVQRVLLDLIGHKKIFKTQDDEEIYQKV